MKEKTEMLSTLKTLALDRAAARLMQEDLARIAEDETRQALPDAQREALARERAQLEACLAVTSRHIARTEGLLACLTPEERRVLDHSLIHPVPGAVFDLAEEFHCETSSVYRIRARALKKLVRLRYGAGI